MTTKEYMLTLPVCDLLIIDENDQTVYEDPYQFPNYSTETLNGIWNWNEQ